MFRAAFAPELWRWRDITSPLRRSGKILEEGSLAPKDKHVIRVCCGAAMSDVWLCVSGAFSDGYVKPGLRPVRVRMDYAP